MHHQLIDHGTVAIHPALIEAAEQIKHQNYQVNTPKKFQKNTLHTHACQQMCQQIANLLQTPVENVDFVYFACSQGAEEHVDELDPAIFSNQTILVPLILPSGNTQFFAHGKAINMQLAHAYAFNHETPHSLSVEDTASGCVLLMASVKHAT